ncbi:MAG: hypothetical protein IH934_05945 [Nanoarchaeota archaeon]|nr:hypothetical protein [Nanoarchaeota archaeon]
MLTEKEKLEEELKLLEESLDLKVITEEEYETAKARVDSKLKGLDASEEKKDVEEKEIKEEPKPEDKKEEQKIEIKELKTEQVERKEPIKEEEVKESVKKEEEEKQEEPKKEELTEEEQKIKDTQKSEISGTTYRGFPTSKSKDFEEIEKDTITLDFSWLKNIFRKKEPVTEEKQVEELKAEEKPEEQKTLDEVKEAEDKPEETITEEKPVEVKEEKDEVKAEEVKPEEVKPVEEKKVEEDIKVTEEKLAEDIKKEEEKEEIKAEEEKPEEEVKEEEPIKEEGIVDEEIKINEKNKFFSSIESISHFLYNKKLFAYVAIILILVVGSWYFYYSGPNDLIIRNTPTNIPTGNVVNLIACSSDNECKKEGSIGICNNPGQEDAECEYIQDVKIQLTVLNSDNCFNCGTARVLSILKSFYPNINVENIDFESKEGKEIKEKFLITALPAYIFNSSFKESYNYNKFSSSFNEARGSFVMKNNVANSNYYLEREEIPNKLDLFVKFNQTASLDAEENLEKFLEVFKGNVNFTKHNEDSEIVKELGINTFPAFLINNKIKFGGVQSADKIRENFCKVNSVTPCVLGLSKSLV